MTLYGRIEADGITDARRSPKDEDYSHLKAVSFERVITFGDTSAAGIVYYSKFVEWQGQYREVLGFRYAPEYMAGLGGDVTMLTHSCSCEYYSELWPGDRVEIKLIVPWIRLEFMRGLYFYYRTTNEGQQLVARGEQIFMSARRDGNTFSPGPWPRSILKIARAMGVDTSRALFD
jgi:acyl-CoA thioesterase FadM